MSYLADLAAGRRAPSLDVASRLDVVLDAGGALIALVPAAAVDDELDALELARRAQASDVGGSTLTRLETVHVEFFGDARCAATVKRALHIGIDDEVLDRELLQLRLAHWYAP